MKYRNAIAVVVLVCLAVALAGCSKDEAIAELKDAGYMILKIFGAILLIGILMLAWCHHKVTGVLVTLLMIAGGIGYHYWAHAPYEEPASDQPHAVMKFVMIPHVGIGLLTERFTVWIDDCDIDFSPKQDGKVGYAIRVTPGDHDIRVSYDATYMDLATSESREDLTAKASCPEGETVFFVLSSAGGSISVKEITEFIYTVYTEYFQYSAEERLNNLNLLKDIERRERRKMLGRLVDEKIRPEGMSDEEWRKLRSKYIDRLEKEPLVE